MARKKIPKLNNHPYHIWARSNNKEWFSVDPDTCWNIFCDFLNYTHRCYELKIHSFVLMSNHYHLLASTTTETLPLIMNRLHTEVSKAINEESGRKNHVFGGRYQSSLISNLNHYEKILKYVYQNPVKAQICGTAEDYKYSTLSGLYGSSRLLLPVDRSYEEACGLPDDLEAFLSMINTPLDEDEREQIHKGLKKSEFKPAGKRTLKR